MARWNGDPGAGCAKVSYSVLFVEKELDAPPRIPIATDALLMEAAEYVRVATLPIDAAATTKRNMLRNCWTKDGDRKTFV